MSSEAVSEYQCSRNEYIAAYACFSFNIIVTLQEFAAVASERVGCNERSELHRGVDGAATRYAHCTLRISAVVADSR